MSQPCFGRRLVLATLVALAANVAHAAPSGVLVTHAWTRPAAAAMNAAGYMVLANRAGLPDRLIGASSPSAARVSLHQSRQVGSVMTMRALPGIDVPGRGQVVLAPGGYHLMLEGLKQPLKPGARVAVRLSFLRAGPVRALLAVRVTAPGMARMPGM